MLPVVTLLVLSLFGRYTLALVESPVGGDEWTASGSGDGDYDEEDNEYDYDTNEGSGGTVTPAATVRPGRTRCIDLRDAKLLYDDIYRPQCTDTGAFRPMQCHQPTGECWCVDADGNDIPGTIMRSPHQPNCTEGGRRPVEVPVVPARTTDNDFTIDPSTRSPITQKATGPPIVIDDDVDDVRTIPPRNWPEYVTAQPLILAGLIGGAILILLVIILMLMFIVYRMRKKDEGSYSLDEPRQSFGYTRAKDQEFFA